MSREERVAKTIDKMRRGGLPAPTNHNRLIGQGDGRPCDGCGETIHQTETRYSVSTHQTFDWRFHAECYAAWARFTH